MQKKYITHESIMKFTNCLFPYGMWLVYLFHRKMNHLENVIKAEANANVKSSSISDHFRMLIIKKQCEYKS